MAYMNGKIASQVPLYAYNLIDLLARNNSLNR